MSQADLATSYAQLKPILTKAEPSSLLAGLIGAPEVVKVAEKNGAGSSDDDAKKLLDSVAKQAGVTPSGEWTSDALLLAKSDLGYQKLQAMSNGAGADRRHQLGDRRPARPGQPAVRHLVQGDDRCDRSTVDRRVEVTPEGVGGQDERAASGLVHLADLVDVMDRLRSPGGCPWDAEQTHESLVGYAVEEVFEVAEAVETGDRAHLREELGDLLLQVVFQARVAQEHPTEPFDLEDVAAGIAAKLRRRHPHVFGDVEVADAQDVHRRWEQIKAAEKGARLGARRHPDRAARAGQGAEGARPGAASRPGPARRRTRRPRTDRRRSVTSCSPWRGVRRHRGLTPRRPCGPRSGPSRTEHGRRRPSQTGPDAAGPSDQSITSTAAPVTRPPRRSSRAWAASANA